MLLGLNQSFFFTHLLGKKARTFDLEAMFEQTRRTAVERSKKMLGKIGESPVLVYLTKG